MNKTLRRAVIAGNWKMNKTPAEATALINEIKPLVANADCGIIICVPFVALPAALEAVKGSNIKVGSQNMHWEEKGAFTGEISAQMLTSLGVEYVIIGHSERRQYFAETNTTVNKKVLSALKASLKPILCVGETLSEREDNITFEIIAMQTKKALQNVDEKELQNIILAYEPVWAIGTGRTATAEQANEVCQFIRNTVKTLYGAAAGDAMTIQYGGSMNAANANELLSKEDVDGGLIGGAALKPTDFAAIIDAAK